MSWECAPFAQNLTSASFSFWHWVTSILSQNKNNESTIFYWRKMMHLGNSKWNTFFINLSKNASNSIPNVFKKYPRNLHLFLFLDSILWQLGHWICKDQISRGIPVLLKNWFSKNNILLLCHSGLFCFNLVHFPCNFWKLSKKWF